MKEVLDSQKHIEDSNVPLVSRARTYLLTSMCYK